MTLRSKCDEWKIVTLFISKMALSNRYVTIYLMVKHAADKL